MSKYTCIFLTNSNHPTKGRSLTSFISIRWKKIQLASQPSPKGINHALATPLASPSTCYRGKAKERQKGNIMLQVKGINQQ